MSTASETRRDRRRAETRTEILAAAREQVAETGELSFRAVGRQVGITAPGLYHYFALGTLQVAVAQEIALAAMHAADDWDGYARWVAQNPMRFAFLARHPKLIAEVHAAVAGAA